MAQVAPLTITEIGCGACHHRPMADVTRPRRREAYAERFARGDSYGLLLALLLVLYIVMAATRTPEPLGALGHQHAARRGDAADVAHLARALTRLPPRDRDRGRSRRRRTSSRPCSTSSTGTGASFLMFLLVLVAPIVILNRILRHETVGLETILGAICIYVLIAIAFSGLYGWVNEVEPNGFFAQQIPNPQNVDFLYFSFVTITTVGYGDLTAGTSIGRVLVTFEALIGQIFLVTLVARLVGMYGTRWCRATAGSRGPARRSDLERVARRAGCR